MKNSKIQQLHDVADETGNQTSAALSAAALLEQVGRRVYNARKSKRLSRRELSEQSGVSPRYISRLESGEGNISISLLHRIGIALDQPIEWLVSTNDELADDLAKIIVRYRSADAATRAKVLKLLDPAQLREQKAQRICLIGLRGAGKSTLGAQLGRDMNLPFIELNQEIERSAGMPIGEVIAMYGEQGFRKLEADKLKTIIATHERLVLAVAGGVIEKPDTYVDVLDRFHTVWLKASPAEHMQRVQAQGDMRPMAGNPQAMEQLRGILAARESRYGQADYHLDTSGKTVKTSLIELRALVLSHDLII